MKFVVVCEGETEEHVVKKVCPRGTVDIVKKAGGIEQVNNQLVATIGPFLEGGVPVSCLVLCDLDKHNGITQEQIVQSLGDALSRMFSSKLGLTITPSLKPLPAHPNVFCWISQQPAIRVALHIADYRWKPEFIKATIDDYILALALEPETVKALARSQEIDPGRLRKKIEEELPTLLEANGIPLNEAKDYVRLYAAVIKAHTSPAVFAQKTLANAQEADIEKCFASLYAACKALVQP